MADLHIDKFSDNWYNYDWAITGANCMIYLSSKEKEVKRQIKNIPTLAVGYKVQQNKAPVYGYNDIGPRIMMEGTRIVSGQLVIAHREVGYLMKCLRNVDGEYGTDEKLSLQETLRIKYWNTRNWDASTMTDPQRDKFRKQEDKYNLFYRHPNFDISIVYGVGDDIGQRSAKEGYLDLTSILSEIRSKTSEWYAKGGTGGFQDVNPIYRPSTIDLTKQRETITGVQLTGMGKEISADGDIIVEAYSFLAVDVIPK